MEPVVYDYYRDFIFVKFPPPGKRILEVGALISPWNVLGILAAQQSDHELIGINLDFPKEPPKNLGYKLLVCNANDMSIFSDSYFDAVICEGVFNNDKYFWKSLSEIRRVLRPDGLFYMAVPGFEGGAFKLRIKRWLYKIGKRYKNPRLYRFLVALAENTWLSAIATYHYSPTPKDYYRFSEDTIKEVVMEGFDLLHCESLLYPPRFLAVGRKKP